MSRGRKATLAIALSLTALVAGTAPAAAHDELVVSSPGAGEVVGSPPTTVSMIFSAELMTDGAVVAVTSENGKEWVVGAPTVAGFELISDLAAPLPDGEYEVRWRVVSSDGHPISGMYPFTVGSLSEQTDPRAGTPTGDASSHLSTADSRNDRSISWDPWWLTAAACAVIVGILLTVRVLTRRPKVSGEAPSHHPG